MTPFFEGREVGKLKRIKKQYGIGKRNPWSHEGITDWKWLKENRPDDWEALRAKMDASSKIKIARSCFTCRHRAAGKGRDSFVECSRRPQKTWVNARCPQWKLTLTPARLSEYERHVETKYLLQNPDIFEHYYGKRTENDTDTTLMLARSCFTCRRRGQKKGNKVHCNERNLIVWTQACCRRWKVENDLKVRLPIYRRLMAKAGAETEGIQTWMEYRVPTNKAIDEISERYDIAVELDKDLPEAEAIAKAKRQLDENWAKLDGWNPDEESLEEFKAKQEAAIQPFELPDPTSDNEGWDRFLSFGSDEYGEDKEW